MAAGATAGGLLGISMGALAGGVSAYMLGAAVNSEEDVTDSLAITQQDIANMHCGNISAGLTVITAAAKGKRRCNLGEEEFNANLNVDNLILMNEGGITDNISGLLDSLDASLSRDGGKKKRSLREFLKH